MKIRLLKQEAHGILQSAEQSPRRITLIHSAVALGVPLVLALISALLDMTVSTGGGLSGMDTRAALSTAQTALQMVSMVAMLFWSVGLVFAALGYIRGERVTAAHLPEGFRRFGAVLTSSLMMGAQYLIRAFAAAHISSILIIVTPFAAPAYNLVLLMEENPNLNPMTANVEGLGMFYAATAVVFAIVLAVLVLPVVYRYRMVPYLIMDGKGMGGLRAMMQSRLMTQGRRWELFRLDLSFWWFYVLEFLLTVVSMGGLVTELVGVSLPISADAVYWIFQLVAAVLQLTLYVFVKPKLEITYALCYRDYLQPEPIPEPESQPPKPNPWNY